MTPQRFVRPLTSAEFREIEDLYRRGPNARTRKRAHAIRLSSLEYSVPQIVEILGCTRQTVHNWFDAFEAGGVDGLSDKSRSGRPAKADADYRQLLVDSIRVNPHDLGYPFTVWTITRIRAHMARETSVLLSETRVRDVMKEENLVFKRPKHSLKDKRDEDAFAAVRDLLGQAKKSPGTRFRRRPPLPR